MRKPTLFSIVGGAALLLTRANVTLAQEPKYDPLVHLTKAQAGHFQQALDALANQGHIALVAEGIPLHPSLKPAEIPVLTADTPLAQAVSQVAVAYDYDVERKVNVFTLKKRYTDPRDLPSVTLDECRLDLADAIRIMNIFSPNIPHAIRTDIPEAICTDFVNTLSPEQRQAMQDKTLRIADLSEAQRKLITRFVNYGYVQMPLRTVRIVMENLEQAQKSTLTNADERGRSDLYLEANHFFDDDPAMPIHEFMKLNQGYTEPDAPSPTLILPVAPSPALKPGKTLGEVAAELNKSGGLSISIESPLQAKTVSVAGLGNAKSAAVVSALMRVYGLRVGATDKGEPKIARQGVLMPTRLQELAPALWHSLPEAYLRAAHYQETVSHESPKVTLADLKSPQRMKQISQEEHRNLMRPYELMAMPSHLRGEAVRQMIVLLQPQLKALPPGGRIPVASLSEPVRDLLGLAVMSSAVGAFANQYRGDTNAHVIQCLDHFDDNIVCGTPYEDPANKGHMVNSMLLRWRDPVTKTVLGLGGVGMDTNPKEVP